MRACDDVPKALTGGKREDRLSKKHRAFLDGFDACIETVDNFLSDPDECGDIASIRNRLETRLNLRRNEISLDFLDKDNKSTL